MLVYHPNFLVLGVAREIIDAIVSPCRALLARFQVSWLLLSITQTRLYLAVIVTRLCKKLKARVTHRRYDDRTNRANRRELVLQFCCSRSIHCLI